MIDLDLFKEVNDRYGHLSGDQVLRSTASILRDQFRRGDFVFRYGGDEFMVLLPGAGHEESARLAARARRAMHDHEFLSFEEEKVIDVPLTFCIGVASYPEDGTTPKDLIAHADALLYEEKRKARVRSGSQLPTIGRIAGALLVAIVPVLVFLRWDDVVGPRAIEPPAIETNPVEVEEVEAERMLMLEQIEELERRLAELQQNEEVDVPEAEGPRAAAEENPEIEALRKRIEELNEELQTERIAAPPPLPRRERFEPFRPVDPTLSTNPPGPRRGRPAESSRADTPVAITPPGLLRPIEPRYPPVARRLGREATVDLIVRVAPNGRVVHARIVGQSPGFGFGEAAVRAALESSWAPGRRNGEPVQMETGLRVTFRMPE